MSFMARYLAAAHAMQSGVAMLMNYEPEETTPKHLRVGINSAMADHGALVTLLIARGVFTSAEYEEAIAAAMEREADNYRVKLRELIGPQVDLA